MSGFDHFERQLFASVERLAGPNQASGQAELSPRGRRRVARFGRSVVPYFPLAAAIAVVAAVGGLFVGLRGGRLGIASPGSRGIDSRLLAGFPLLGRPLTANDRIAIPENTIKAPAPRSRLGSRLGIESRLAHRLAVPGSSVAAWAVPGSRGMCLIALLRYNAQRLVERSDCEPTLRALSRPMFVTGAGLSVRTLVGLVGSGVPQVALNSGGRRTRLALRAGVFIGVFKRGDCLQVPATGLYAIGTPAGSCVREAFPHHSTELVTRIDSRILSTYGVFRRPRHSSDRAPAGIARLVRARPARIFPGANLALSRRTGSTVLIPAQGEVCVFTGVGGTCEPNNSFLQGFLDYYTSPVVAPTTTLVDGLVPDGVNSVEIEVRGAPTVRVPVHDDGFRILIHGTVRATIAVGPGPRRRRLQLTGFGEGPRIP